MNAQPRGSAVSTTNSCDFSPHQAGRSVRAAGSSASTDTSEPTGTSRIRAASMMMGTGHLRPSASMVSAAAGGAAPATWSPWSAVMFLQAYPEPGHTPWFCAPDDIGTRAPAR